MPTKKRRGEFEQLSLLDEEFDLPQPIVAPALALKAQTPHGTFGCGQAERALLRTWHF
jgi:hypothetical protein